MAILRQAKVDTILQNFTYFAVLIYIRHFLDISFYYFFKGDLAQMLIMIRVRNVRKKNSASFATFKFIKTEFMERSYKFPIG